MVQKSLQKSRIGPRYLSSRGGKISRRLRRHLSRYLPPKEATSGEIEPMDVPSSRKMQIPHQWSKNRSKTPESDRDISLLAEEEFLGVFVVTSLDICRPRKPQAVRSNQWTCGRRGGRKYLTNGPKTAPKLQKLTEISLFSRRKNFSASSSSLLSISATQQSHKR